MNPEARLLKFCGPTSYALQNLENGQIFCQHYAAYNDPFEFWTTIPTGIPDPDSEPERYLAALRAWGLDCRTVDEAKDRSEEHTFELPSIMRNTYAVFGYEKNI